MVRLRLAGDIGEVVVAQAVPLRESSECGDVVLAVLQAQAAMRLRRQPCRVVVQRVGDLRVGCLRQGHAGRAGKRPEVVVEGVVLFDDDDDVFDRVRVEVLFQRMGCLVTGRAARVLPGSRPAGPFTAGSALPQPPRATSSLAPIGEPQPVHASQPGAAE